MTKLLSIHLKFKIMETEKKKRRINLLSKNQMKSKFIHWENQILKIVQKILTL